MSAALPNQGSGCCTPCDDVPNIQIPGATGAAGSDGDDGSDGVNAFTLTTAAFTQPAVAGTETVPVNNSTWIVVGQILFITSGGYYQVTAVPTVNSVTVKNLGYTGSPVYTAPAASVASGSKVSPGGLLGLTTTTGVAGAGGGDLKGNYPDPSLDKPNTLGSIIVGDGTNAVEFAVGADTLVLHSDAVAGNRILYRNIDLTGVETGLAGSLGLANGGTTGTTKATAFDALSPVIAQGGMVTANAAGVNIQITTATNGHLPQSDGTDTTFGFLRAINFGAIGSALGATPVKLLIFRDVKASGSNGGSATAGGVWNTRTLSEETVDTGGIGSLAANVITLTENGWYRCRLYSPMSGVSAHQCRLFQVGAAVVPDSYSVSAYAGADQQSIAMSDFRFQVTAQPKSFVLQYRCQVDSGSTGLGRANSFASEEVYGMVVLEKEAAIA